MGAKHILVVEDEEAIRETLRFNLSREGYQVSQASNGIEALEKVRELRPDLIVLDLMLPELGGLEVCRILRQETTTPVLVLSARDSELDKIVGLRVGADDYMTKPFSLAELTARVMALLRRAQPAVEDRAVAEVEVLGELRFDRGARSVRIGHEDLRLSPKEFDLLSFMLAHPGRVHSREQLIRRVWGPKFFGERKTVDVHVRWLREKFEPFEALPFRITTVYGVGYRLDRIQGQADAASTTWRSSAASDLREVGGAYTCRSRPGTDQGDRRLGFAACCHRHRVELGPNRGAAA